MSNHWRCPKCQDDTLQHRHDVLRCYRCDRTMSLHDRFPHFLPGAPPDAERVWRGIEGKEIRPFVLCWIRTDGTPTALSAHRLYKTAVNVARAQMRDASSRDLNRATRFYIWDSRRLWVGAPEGVHAPFYRGPWIPIAEKLADQLVLAG